VTNKPRAVIAEAAAEGEREKRRTSGSPSRYRVGYGADMGELAGDMPEGSGADVPRRHSAFDDLDIVFDEAFVRAASIHEPSARARMLASRWQDEPPEATGWRDEVGFEARAVTVIAPTRRHFTRVAGWAITRWALRHPILVRLGTVAVTAAATLGILYLVG
jgi:hypothetical protein